MHRRKFLSTAAQATACGAAALSSLISKTGSQLMAAAAPARATGPLKIHPQNPRYFADGSGRPVYLAGAHTWANLQDIGVAPLPKFDWPKYLDMMQSNRLNFMRLWQWLQAEGAPWTEDKILFEPLPYLRTGPGTALDGKPKFDLTKFNQAYFDRMHSRTAEAGDRGIYVAVQLFQGFSVKKGTPCDPWPSHPYNGKNNINGFDGEKDKTSDLDLNRADVRAMQETYLHKVIDTVNNLDNVLYEVINEGGNKDWDWWVIDTVHTYEAKKSQQHPVGLTGCSFEKIDEMLASRAEWVSPGVCDAGAIYKSDPPAWNEKKVSLLDTDHLWGHGGTPWWVWKSICRGHNPVLMDSWEPIPGKPCGNPNWMSRPGYLDRNLNRYDDWTWEPVRLALRNTQVYAMRMNLARAVPSNDLATSRYCLADSGKTYLVYLPEGDEVTLDLSATSGTFAVEWMTPIEGKITPGGTVQGGSKPDFAVPFPGPAVLFVNKA
jgi:hypothetical protein